MSDKLYIGTRKGLFTYERNGTGWEVGRVDFVGENVSMLMHDHRDGWLYAALNLGHFGMKLHRSSDGGANWEECGVPVFPEGGVVATPSWDPDVPPGTKPASLSEIWALEPGGDDEPDVLWAGTIPGALFRSTDRGSTWELNEPLWNREERMKWFGGGKDESGVHSIAVHPEDSKHITLGVSCGGVWVTEDGGDSWHQRGHGLRAEFMPPDMQFDPDSQDPHRLVQCAADPDTMWIQHHNGIFRKPNGAQKWEEIGEAGPSTFGFAVCVHPHDPQTAWFVPGVKDECRVPVDAQLVVTRTRDGGQSFETLRNGLPQEHCYDIVFRHGLDIDTTGDQLAMGSSTGGLWTSDNGGDDWTCVSNVLPQIYCVRFER